MLKKNIFTLLAMITGGFLLSSCGNDKNSTGWEFMPDMYRGPALEAYQPNSFFSDSLASRKPVAGTIARGFMSYEKFDNTTEGYDLAKANMKMPSTIVMDEMNLEDAAKLYGIFCSQCHGAKGDGQGILTTRDKFNGIPSYADREITNGSIFHVITYGKGMMGSHAAQLTPEERWKVSHHVLQLRKSLTGEGEETQADEAVEVVVETTETVEPATEENHDTNHQS